MANNKAISILIVISVLILTAVAGYLIFAGQPAESRQTPSDNSVTLQLVPPPDFDPSLLDDFHTAYPGIRVEAVSSNRPRALDGWSGLDMTPHLDAHEEYVSRGDVVYVEDRHLNAEAMLTGYYLDMSPLTNSDASLNSSDYLAAVWDSFAGSGAMYGFPLAARVHMLQFNPALLDEAGIPYPNEDMTADDFLTLLEALQAGQEAGTPVFFVSGQAAALLKVLLNPVDTPATLETVPDFADPTNRAIINRWADLLASGAIVEGVPAGYTLDDVALQMTPAGFFYQIHGDDTATRRLTLLPGGLSLLDVGGFAINQSTDHVNAAYSLINYLNQRAPELFLAPNVDVFALERHNDPQENPTRDNRYQARLRAHAARALPTIDTRYYHYLSTALQQQADSDTADAGQAVANAQSAATDAIDQALSRRTDQTTINNPRPTAIPGQDTLVFGGMSAVMDVETDTYQTLVQTFVMADDEIGAIERYENNTNPLEGYSQETDCFFFPTPANQYPGAMNLIDMMPLIQVDTALSDDPLFAEAVSLLEANNELYGYPLLLSPSVIFYDDTAISADDNLSATEFEQLLLTNGNNDDDLPVFAPARLSPVYILALATANDALLYDTRQMPPTLNTDERTVQQVQAVLDMAKAGLIEYQPLQENAGRPGQQDAPLKEESWQAFEFRRFITENEGGGLIPADYGLMLYPEGNQFAPLIVDVGAVYINAQSSLTDACYRWANHLAANAMLFMGGMPANSEALDAVSNPENATFFEQVRQRLQSDKRIILPPPHRPLSLSQQAHMYWLAGAFDAYVLDEANLSDALQAVRNSIDELRNCEQAATLSTSSVIMECLMTIDPEAAGNLQQGLPADY